MHTYPAIVVTLMLLLTECAPLPPMGQQSWTAPTTPEFNMNPNYRYEMDIIGGRYEADTVPPQPGRLEADITSCYRQVALWEQYADQSATTCLILDYTGYKDNQIATRNYRELGNPFFSMDAAEARWKVYGPIARFSSPEEMFDFLRGSYAFVKPDALSSHPPTANGPLREHGELYAP